MNKTVRITLIVLVVLALAGGLVFAGMMVGNRLGIGFYRPGFGMMNNRANYRPGMMNRGSGYGPGMMNGQGYGNGMMGNRAYPGNSANIQPLTVDQAYKSAGNYLTSLNNSDLKIAEVMVFDNNAYVRVVEKSSGIGAFELLVDPATQSVSPEPGPDMMWNLKYGGLNQQNMMGGRGGRMGGMMGNYVYSSTPSAVSASMPVTSAQALQAAQQYLDTALPGSKTAADADPFYGYYTIDILRDGKVTGMLSVNGYSSQVFMHTWHGTFIATQDF